MKKIITFLGLVMCSFITLFAQDNPISWSFSSEKNSNSEYTLMMTAVIEKPWHLYALDSDPVFTTPTKFSFNESSDFSIIGNVEQPKPIVEHDEDLGIDLKYFGDEVTFKQKVKVTGKSPVVEGSIVYMACDDARCLPPENISFSINLEKNQATSDVSEYDGEPTIVSADAEESEPAQKKSLLNIFLVGLVGGLVALVTPCVWPMIPMTVSYFLKSSGDKKKGIKNAIYYGLSIIVIYDLLGLGVTLIFGDDALNTLATNPWINVFLFLILVVFAISFFGAFELTLPSKWVNKMDENADSKGGIIGIFFMALTLVLVSFSCTAPIVGTLLVEIVTGGLWGPLVGMTGFALALAVPFSLFAIFPSWLNNMPKSGGWMNSVKVVLAFLELALSMKFLSTADEMMNWRILDRETFIAIWIIIFGMLGFYLLGKIKFKHDSDVEHVSVFRLFLSIICLAFTVYMIPGLWGAPLNAIAAFTPKMYTQDFKLGGENTTPTVIMQSQNQGTTSQNLCNPTPKYSDILHLPEGYQGYFDFDEALACAREMDKPLLLDFTGHNCVNCRKMENAVWTDDAVKQIINEEFIVAALFVDNLNDLNPEDYVTVTEENGKTTTITKIGKKWKHYQRTKYAINSQPCYIIIDNDENVLAGPYGFDNDIQKFIDFLNSGINNYKK